MFQRLFEGLAHNLLFLFVFLFIIKFDIFGDVDRINVTRARPWKHKNVRTFCLLGRLFRV